MAVVKPLVITAVALAVVAGAGVVGDSIARDQAEQQVAKAVQSSLGLETAPEVTLGGVPFTAALVTRTVPDARLTATDVPLEVSGQLITVSSVDATAREIALHDSQIEVGSVRADAVLPYDAVSTIAGVPVEAAGDGRVKVSYTADLFGQSLVAAVSAVPELDVPDQQVRLTQTRIEIAGFPLSEQVAQSIMDSVVRPIPLELPYDVMLESLGVADSGLLLTASAEDVTVPMP